jgi:hypothetical protein
VTYGRTCTDVQTDVTEPNTIAPLFGAGAKKCGLLYNMNVQLNLFLILLTNKHGIGNTISTNQNDVTELYRTIEDVDYSSIMEKRTPKMANNVTSLAHYVT